MSEKVSEIGEVVSNEVTQEAASANPSGISYSAALILCFVSMCLTLIIVFLGYTYLSKHQSSGPKVVYFDYQSIADAAAKKAYEQGYVYIKGDVKADADQFTKNIKTEVDAYVNSGFILLQRTSVIAGNPSADITNDLIKKLGVDK